MEVVVILRNIGEDAQPVWYPQSNHILCIQQGWDPQLLLRHSECLEKGKKNKKKKKRVLELLLMRSKKLRCKQPHLNDNSTGEQLHQFNSSILRPLQEPTESWLPATTLRNSGREPKIWPGKLAVAQCAGTHLGFPCSASICPCTAAESGAWQKGMCQPGLADAFPRLPDAFPGFQPNLERSPANGAPVGACRQLFISERRANVNASRLLKKKGKSGAEGGSSSPRLDRGKRGITQNNS